MLVIVSGVPSLTDCGTVVAVSVGTTLLTVTVRVSWT